MKIDGISIPYVFGFEVSQNEGEIALVKIWVPMTNEPYIGKTIEIIDQDTLVFKGECISSSFDQGVMLLIGKAFYDFVPPLSDDLWHFNRQTGKVEKTSFFEGVRILNLNHLVFEKTLRIQKAHEPITTWQGTMVFEWTQNEEGEINLFQILEKAFPFQRVNTLTPEALIQGWPQIGSTFHGYTVVESKLFETYLDSYYPKIGIRDGKEVKRFWFDGKLSLYFKINQPRKNLLSITLESPYKGQKFHHRKSIVAQGLSEDVFLKSLDSHVKHYIDFAVQAMRASFRCFEVECEVPLTYDISLQDAVQLIVGEEEMIGKVIAYRFYKMPSNQYTWIRLGIRNDYKIKTPIIDPLAYEKTEKPWIESIQVFHDAGEQLISKDLLPTRIEWGLQDIRTQGTITTTMTPIVLAL